MVSLVNEYPFQVESVDIGKKGILANTKSSILLLGQFSESKLGEFPFTNCLDSKFSAFESQALAINQKNLLHFALDTGKSIREYPDESRVLAVSGGNANLVATGHINVTLWDIRRRMPIKTLKTHQKGTTSLIFGDGFLLSGGKEGTLKKWDLKSSRSTETISRHEHINDIKVSEDMIGVLYKNIIRIYDLNSYEVTLTLPVPDTHSISFFNSSLFTLGKSKVSQYSTQNSLLICDWKIPENPFKLHDSLMISYKSPLSIHSVGLEEEKPPSWMNLGDKTKVIRMPLESRAMSERSFISLDEMSVIETDIHDNRPIPKLKVSLASDDPLQGHSQFMTLMNKRMLSTDKIIEAWETSGLTTAINLLQRAEMPVQALFFNKISQKRTIFHMGNAEALLEIIVKMCRAKSPHIVDVASKVTGLIFQEVSQPISSALTSKLQVPLEQKQEALSVYKLIEQCMKILKSHNRGFVELVDLEFFFERINESKFTI